MISKEKAAFDPRSLQLSLRAGNSATLKIGQMKFIKIFNYLSFFLLVHSQGVCVYVCVRVRVCVCDRERERERERERRERGRGEDWIFPMKFTQNLGKKLFVDFFLVNM
jgi:hypothetical protein